MQINILYSALAFPLGLSSLPVVARVNQRSWISALSIYTGHRLALALPTSFLRCTRCYVVVDHQQDGQIFRRRCLGHAANTKHCAGEVACKTRSAVIKATRGRGSDQILPSGFLSCNRSVEYGELPTDPAARSGSQCPADGAGVYAREPRPVQT